MDTKTLRCGLLGRKLGHSYSPAIHERLADYSYRLFEVEPEDLGAFLQEGAFDGLNVTIPYKKDVIPYCAELSDTARAIGAVNTLVCRADGTLWGDNTDAYGFSMLVQSSGADVAGKKALVFGSGGASATAQYVLRQLGAREVVVISRHGEDNYENLDRHADAQIAVNTTPVGMYPNTGVSPVGLHRLPRLEAALDVVYNPARTEFLLQAEARGLRRGKMDLRAARDEHTLAGAGRDLALCGADGQRSLQHVVDLVVVQRPGKVAALHRHQPQPKPGRILQREKIVRKNAVGGIAGVQPVGFRHTVIRRKEFDRIFSQLFRQNLTNQLLKLRSVHMLSPLSEAVPRRPRSRRRSVCPR